MKAEAIECSIGVPAFQMRPTQGMPAANGEERPMNESDLNARFPELELISSPPGIWYFMGCGMLLRGRRDFDEETQSYIQTHCLCILGLPILAYRAYRVVDVPNGKYFLGREPLSIPAKALSAFVLLAALVAGGVYGWETYTSSPDFVAHRMLVQADELAAAGKLAEAARLCREVASGSTTPPAQTTAAVDRITTLLADPKAQDSATELAGVFAAAVALERSGRWPRPGGALFEQGMALQNQRSAADAAGALAILEAVAPLAPRAEDLNKIRRALLEKLVSAHPGDPELASRLAAVFEAQGQEERCVALLEPLRGQLGTTEGARILGLADARHDRLDRALALLRPYVNARLDSLQTAETDLRAAVDAAQQAVIERLKNERPSDFDFEHYFRSSTFEQSAQIEKYVAGKLKGDPAIDQAQERMMRVSSVVPAALELGTILLHRAQSQADPKTRKSELDEAEKYFVAVGGFAGESDAVRLNLAQVYYWQGKHKEGKALFDEVLKAGKRDPKLLIDVSGMLRGVGSNSEARALAEEAFNTAQDLDVKQSAAIQRGLLGVELDDKILWLGRGNPSHPGVKAMLDADLAEQAMNQGDDDKAVAKLKEASGLYDSMPESPEVLNNSALTLFRLARLTGDKPTFDRGLAKIERAAKLDPSNGLMMANAGNFLLEEALRDVIGPSIDLALLKEDPDIEMLSYLYSDQSGRMSYVERLRSHAGINRAIGLLDKAMLLAPRRPTLYKLLDELYHYRGDVERQRALLRRLEPVELDQADEIGQWRDFLAGRRDDEIKKRTTAEIARAEAALTAARAKKPDLTFAVAAAQAARKRIMGYPIGLEADRDAIVAVAEEAYSVTRAHRVRSTLIGALLFRAGGRLARSQPEYAKLEAKTRRSTGDAVLIGVALGGESALRDAVSKDPDVRRAVDLIREAYRKDPPYEAGAWSWSLVRASHPQDAAMMAQTYLKDESNQLSRAIKRRVEPCAASVPLDEYWTAQMQGKAADSRDVIKEYLARGIPLPIEAP
jgi:tetratricopeptide (TPR) repeat protein